MNIDGTFTTLSKNIGDIKKQIADETQEMRRLQQAGEFMDARALLAKLGSGTDNYIDSGGNIVTESTFHPGLSKLNSDLRAFVKKNDDDIQRQQDKIKDLNIALKGAELNLANYTTNSPTLAAAAENIAMSNENTFMYVAIIVFVVVVAGFIYFRFKRKKSKTNTVAP